MATHAFTTYSMKPFWDDEYKLLPYTNEPFNDPIMVKQWEEDGFQGRITGDLADMRGEQPSWNHKFVTFFEHQGWRDVGTAYYRMNAYTVMPEHYDIYRAYVNKFNLHEKRDNIRRAIVFLEDWKPGHYLEVLGKPFVEWRAGQVVEWTNSTPHMAANLGVYDRYTLQITGHVE